MSSMPCDAHPDQEAVNGCRLCEQERIDGLSDLEVLDEIGQALGSASHRRIETEYAEMLAERLRSIVDASEPELPPAFRMTLIVPGKSKLSPSCSLQSANCAAPARYLLRMGTKKVALCNTHLQELITALAHPDEHEP